MTSLLARNSLVRASASRLICNARLTSNRQAPAAGSHLRHTAPSALPSYSTFSPSSVGTSTRSRVVAASAMAPKAEHVMFEPESLPAVRLVADRANAPADLDLLLIAVTQEDVTKKEGEDAVLSSDRLNALDRECAGILSDCLATGGFEGKKGSQTAVLRVGRNAVAPGLMGAKGVALVGLGKAEDLGPTNSVTSWGPSCFQHLSAQSSDMQMGLDYAPHPLSQVGIHGLVL
ncbi:hypothetical protein DUNSADRAFT_15483 [Dunaliella salina]|uniref:Peptidase M17 leucyl aminopeptidase N-terminal domain-containing protein n=1 Tax=Dunaliella salina TaxID=3046 RepID=A0ABQ7G5A2_DUNSA|nr:hypothetical protein DUNSADRAFT_15483 [Dunaliella salina]|eukprot:KAF5829787.1 hypothetical protein DUNSADRAFT_15483 [Dunaliella salina]